MSAVDEAKEYLRLIRMSPASHRGPLRVFDDPTHGAPLSGLAEKVHSKVTRIAERAYRAESVWHAAAWMLDQASLIAQVATTDGGSGLQAVYDPKFGALVFRGQRDPAWKLEATIFRSPTPQFNAAVALDLFITAMTELMTYDENRMNEPIVHMAGAQHYGEKTTIHDGLATPLLDFTADPQVAIYFACQKADAGGDSEVCVYGMPLGILARLGGRVILPPPWLKRLWAQRGLFLDCARLPRTKDLRDYCFQVLFPPDPEFSEAAFEQGSEGLLPEDPWFARAIAWAIKQAKSRTTSSPKSAGESLIGECGEPPFRWYALYPATMQKSLTQFVDFLEWLALKVVNHKPTYDLATLDLILKDNEPLFRSQLVVWKYLMNLFPDIGTAPDGTVQALRAVSKCVEESGRGNP